MTVTSTTNRVSYAGSGTTGPFTFTFYVLEAADLKVYKRSTAGVETLLTITTDYSVSGVGNPAGGTVTTVAAVAVGETLVVVRDAVNTQTADYVEGDAFPAATHEAALDRRTMVSQRLSERLDRALVLGETDNAGSGAYRANANRITNLAAATENTDAVTLQQVTSLITGAGDLPVPTAGQEYLPLVADAGGGGASYVALTADGLAAGAVDTAAIADANVTTAKIADNAVTLAKIAHATQGDVLYYGASGAPAVLGAGVAGQVLRTDGAAANPAWGWGGLLVQEVIADTAAVIGLFTNIIPVDDTIPQQTEGREILTATITPKNAANTLAIDWYINHSLNSGTYVTHALFKDADADAIYAVWDYVPGFYTFGANPLFWTPAGSTTARTYKVRVGANSAQNQTVNGYNGSRYFGGVMKSRLRIREYAAAT